MIAFLNSSVFPLCSCFIEVIVVLFFFNLSYIFVTILLCFKISCAWYLFDNFPIAFHFFYSIFLSWECVISSVLSHHNKNLKRRDVKALRQTMSQLSDRSVLQLHVAARFYLENKRKTHPRGMRACWLERRKEERERDPALWLILLYVLFSSPLGLTCVNWASQECCLFYLRPSLQSSLDLPLFYFLGLFPSLSFSHHHSGFLFPILSESENEITQSCPILCDPMEL